MTRRYRLDVAYDGTDFAGWAAQPGLRTVQGELERWTATVLRLPVPAAITCAGRTDAGVHARGQVCHIDLPSLVDSGRGGPVETGGLLLRRLTRVLPPDVVVRRVTAAPSGFDARFSAIWRRYVYRLWDDASTVDPLLRTQVARVRQSLDVDALRAAGTCLLGLHDFAAFCRAREGATTIRMLRTLDAVRTGDGTVEITVIADAFCHSMVRSLVGAMTRVAAGARSAGWLGELLSRDARSSDIPVMPAHGLTLEEVGYPPDEDLADRQRTARSVRTMPA